MHELSIVKSMLGIIKREMEKNRLETLKKVRIRVGELTAVEPEALRFSFDTLVKDDEALEGAAMEVDEVPLTVRCSECGSENKADKLDRMCPYCGSTEVDMLTGDELEVVSIEAE